MSPAAELQPGSSPGIPAAGAPGNPGEISAQLRAIVHELNNPLAVVMGFTQLLMLSNGCEGKLRADLDRIYGEMKRVAKGVERLHAFALTLQSRCIAAGEDGVGDARPPSEPPSP